MSDPSLTKRKKGLSGCALGVVSVLVMLLLLVCLFWVWTIRCDRQLASQMEAIQSRGEPVTPDDLEAFYALPEGAVDTTDLYVIATQMLEQSSFAEKDPVPFVGINGEDPPSVGKEWESLSQSEGYLQHHKAEIEMLQEAARLGGAARYPSDYSLGFQMPMPEIQNIRAGARALRLAARVHAHRGEADKVAECLHSMVSLAESTKDEPILVSQLVRVAIAQIAIHAASVEIDEVAFSDEQLKKLQDDFRRIEFNQKFSRAVMGERTMGTIALTSPANVDPASRFMTIVKQDTGEYFGLMEEGVLAMGEPFLEAQVRLQEVDERISSLRGPRHIMTKLVTPSLTRALIARTKATANVRMIDIAIAVKRFELAEKRLPMSLEELTPRFLAKLPVDPFTEGPIQFIPDGGGSSFMLYCVGADGEDNGGREADNVVMWVPPKVEEYGEGGEYAEDVVYGEVGGGDDEVVGEELGEDENVDGEEEQEEGDGEE